MTTLAMLLAGALGALARYETAGVVQRRVASTLPWGTAAVNLPGAVALGLLVAARGAGLVGDSLVTVMGTGFLGAFTTFSTWMVESVHVAGQAGSGGLRAAAVNVFGQLVAGSLAAIGLLTLI